MSHDLWRWSATKLASAIRTRDISSRDVVQAHLDRINAVNPSVNALTVVFADAALAAADAADAVPVPADGSKPLHGVPITVKENIDVCGSATTNGLSARRDLVAKRDAPVIRHLKEAGAIIIGRSNMPDFGMRWHTDSQICGPTLNPWNSSRTPGGSSGGEAAALATGMAPLGIGNDMGGSTRQPAINCGVAGLRPTTGRVSSVMSSIFEYSPTFYDQIAAVNGPMARTVEDLRLALDVMSRPDPTDPAWTPAISPPAPDNVPLRVGLVLDPSGDGVAPAVAHALKTAAIALEEGGYEVEEITPAFIADADQVIQRLYETELSNIEELSALVSDDAAYVLKSALGSGTPDAETYRDAIVQRHRIAVDCCTLMVRHPLILGPVSTLEPFKVGFDLGGPKVMQHLIRSFRLTELCNLLGLPSVAVPVTLANGVPQGVQIIGRKFDEYRCLNAAQIIENHSDITTPITPDVAS